MRFPKTTINVLILNTNIKDIEDWRFVIMKSFELKCELFNGSDYDVWPWNRIKILKEYPYSETL